MRRFVALLLMMCMVLGIAGCAAPATAPSASTSHTQTASKDFPANPFDKSGAPRPLGDDPSAVDRSCRSDADCTIKDVGNCCGHYPACVNTNAKTDPQAVQAQCAKSGMASVCGFPVIKGCKCVKGQCAADAQASAL